MVNKQGKIKSQCIDDLLYSIVEINPDMSESHLVLAFRSAKALYALFQNNYLFDPVAFSEFNPALAKYTGDKLQLALDELCQNNELLCIQVRDECFYPKVIIDPSTLEIYSALPPVIMQARKEGYEDWEILDCLVTEVEIPTGEIYVGKPIDYSSVEDLVNKLDEPDTYPDEYLSVIPMECLKNGDVELFDRFVNTWLREPE